MKRYVPKHMISALLDVDKQHPLNGVASGAVSDSALEELVRLIDSKPFEELERFAGVVSRRESNALCRYLGNNAFKIDLMKIVKVIYFCMSQENYATLFRVWQQAPACTEVLFLLGRYDEPQYRGEDFPVPIGHLYAWSVASMPIVAVVQTSTDIGKGNFFYERLRSIGLEAESALGKLCYQHFFYRATVAQFAQEGDNRLYDVLCDSEKQVQENILVHLLNFGEQAARQLLPTMKNTYQRAFALWKEPSRNYFPRKHQKAYETYVWWYNYHQMVSAFGKDADHRRINYWKQYLHKCTCSRIPKHAMLVMDFGQFIVTEFEGIGAVYIFETTYFGGVVKIKSLELNTAAFKAWLLHDSRNMDRQTHTPRTWEIKQTRVLRKFNII